MSLIPTNPILANYTQTAVINTYDSGVGDVYDTAFNGEGLRTTNNTTGAYLEFNSGGLVASPNGTTTYNIKPVNILPTITPPNITTFGVVDKVIIQNTATSATESISIQSNSGTLFGIEYESATNQDLILQSSSSGSLKYKQTGVSATTKELVLNPESVILQDTNTTPLPQTATLTNDHLYIAGGTSATSPTHTEITDISIISNSHDNIFGGDSTTTIQGASLLMLNTQPNLTTSQQLQITPTDVILTTNGGVPSSASWSSILAGGGATPTLQAVVDTNNGISNYTAPSTATIQSTNFTSGRTLVLNGDGTPTIHLIDNYNGSHTTTFDLDTITLNGVSTTWSSIISAGTPNLNSVLSSGNFTDIKNSIPIMFK